MTATTVGTCARCPARWTATRAAHCGGCHATFTSVTGFDRHRVGGACVDPATRGLVSRPARSAEARGDAWSFPGDGMVYRVFAPDGG